MSEPSKLPDWELALRDGLRRLPSPSPADEFDARVLAALQAPRPWWQTLRQEARPMLAGMACSALLMLAALSWTLQAPSPHPVAAAPSVTPRALDMLAVDRLLDRPGLSADSLRTIEFPPPAAPTTPNDRRRSPTRRWRVSRLNPPVTA